MHQLPYLHSYGEQPMGEGVPSLVIAVTRDGKTGMSGKKLALLFRCDIRDLPSLIYENTGEGGGGKTAPNLTKPRSTTRVRGGGKMVPTHRTPPRQGGNELHLFPTELIAPAAVKRLDHMASKGASPQDKAPLKAFITHFAAKGLDVAIKDALGWQATDRYIRQADEVKPYRPQFRDLYHAIKKKFGFKPTPNVWETAEDFLPGMTAAAREQRDALGLGYIHMAFNDDGKNRLSDDTETIMLLLNVSSSFKEFLENLIGWRSGRWQQRLDLQPA